MRRLLAALVAIGGLAALALGQTSTGANWRSYGPFTGFVSSVPRQAAPVGAITDADSSHDWLFDPTERKLIRRKGSQRADSSFVSDYGQGFMRPRQFGQIQMPQHLFPSLGMLYGSDGFLTHSSIQYATGAFVASESTNTGDMALGEDFTSGGYDVTNSSTGRAEPYLVTPVVTFGQSLGTMTRGRLNADRGQFIAGSRRFLEAGNWVYFPNAYGTPLMWNKMRDTLGAVERIRPWGQWPPMYCPDIPSSSYPASSGTGGTGAWKEGDQFWISVVFKFEDGSYSPPVVPNQITPGTGFGGTTGFVKVKDDASTGSGSNSATYTYIPWRNIPCGPAGTVARVLCRTTKSQNFVPGFRDLRITAIIPDNVTCSYNDPNGDDNALVVNNDIVRFDMMWPPAARYVFANDARTVVCGSVVPNPAAILLCPTGKTASRDLNNDTNGQGYDEQQNLATGSPLAAGDALGVYVSTNTLQLRRTSNGGTLKTKTLSFASNPTVKDLINSINALTVSDSSNGPYEWAAQLAPGADETALATSLQVTTGTAFGDSARFAANGVMGVRSPTWPGVLYFNRTWQLQFQRDEQTLYFTGASPGHAQSATNNFYVGNRRSPPSRAVGRCQGGGALKDRFVVCYEKAIYVLKNVKGGGTGEDNDYRLVPLDENRGCVAWSSIAVGPGVVGYMTPDGYVVTDGESEVLISGDIWSREKQLGEWANEIGKSSTPSSNDSVGTYCHAAFIGRQLHIAYRKSASATMCDRRLVYDFSASTVSYGLGAVLNNGQPFGWSTPLWNNVSAMAEVATDASGPYRFGAVETLNLGRYDKFDFSRADSTIGVSVPITPVAYTVTDIAESYNLRGAEQFLALHKKNGTGFTVSFYRDQNRTDGSGFTLASSTTALYTRSVVDLPTTVRTPTEAFTFRMADNGSGSGTEVWALALKYKVLDSVR